MSTEVWKPIPPLEHYEASSEGRIRSLDRYLPTLNRWGQIVDRFHHGKILAARQHPNGCGGVYLNFYAGGGSYWYFNRAVCWAFHGAPPSEIHEAAHLNRDTFNNRPNNLVWATPAENCSHKILHGTSSSGERNGAARLKALDIVPICEAYLAGESAESIAERYGVGAAATIRMIVSRRNWKTIELPAGMDEDLVLKRRQNLEASWLAAEIRMQERGHSLKP